MAKNFFTFCTLYRDSKIERYQKMWRYMESNTPHTFVYSYEEGVERVLNGSYAFLGESTMLDYLVQRNCNLTQIGGLLDSKGYGIATPKGSRWRDPISQAILFLQEKGVIQVSSIAYRYPDYKLGPSILSHYKQTS